jgi:hypothetical protein
MRHPRDSQIKLFTRPGSPKHLNILNSSVNMVFDFMYLKTTNFGHLLAKGSRYKPGKDKNICSSLLSLT